MCLFRTALFVSAMVVAASATAQVVTRFDGTYAKVSSEPVVTSGVAQNCSPVGAGQLIITRGIGYLPWGDGSLASGWVDSHGMLMLQAPNGLHLDAQIETSGTVKATAKLPACSYAVVWQKKP